MTPEQIETLKEQAACLENTIKFYERLEETTIDFNPEEGLKYRDKKLRHARFLEVTRAAIALAEERQEMETGKNQSASKWSVDGRDIVDEEGLCIAVTTCPKDAKHVVNARNDAVNGAWEDGYSQALAAANKAIGGGA